jgi:hypothetical protein
MLPGFRCMLQMLQPMQDQCSLYNAYYREESLKNPTAEEWAAFEATCNLRDMARTYAPCPLESLVRRD